MTNFEPSLQVQTQSSMGSFLAQDSAPEQATGRRIPPKLYRIGEIVSYSGMSRQTIHNYTTMGLLKETRWTEGGHRLYDESVFPRLDEIIRLRHDNKSIQEIRQFFESSEASA